MDDKSFNISSIEKQYPDISKCQNLSRHVTILNFTNKTVELTYSLN
ncbi:MAG: hypothetical protein HRT90_04005 [Candidatus Margulisbacteria bacterium]|nr:hypothetical protein [Candidatus Margulisiibacteriota bacterium]